MDTICIVIINPKFNLMPLRLQQIPSQRGVSCIAYEYLLNHTAIRQVTHLPLAIISYMHKDTYTYMFVVNFDALAQASDIRIERRQVVFLCWMQDSNLESLRHLIASRLNAQTQTDWVIEDQAKQNLNSTARPYDEWKISPLDFIVDWRLALSIYISVVNFDDLAQASDIF